MTYLLLLAQLAAASAVAHVPPTVPNPALTPGVVTAMTQAEICSTKWGADRRHVTPAMRRQVLANYGLLAADVKPAASSGHANLCCEIDHLIPRELGGADDVGNLWTEPWADAHIKDIIENRLHKAVCAGTITLAAAQDMMRTWPLYRPAPQTTLAPLSPNDRILTSPSQLTTPTPPTDLVVK